MSRPSLESLYRERDELYKNFSETWDNIPRDCELLKAALDGDDDALAKADLFDGINARAEAQKLRAEHGADAAFEVHLMRGRAMAKALHEFIDASKALDERIKHAQDREEAIAVFYENHAGQAGPYSHLPPTRFLH